MRRLAKWILRHELAYMQKQLDTLYGLNVIHCAFIDALERDHPELRDKISEFWEQRDRHFAEADEAWLRRSS